MSDRQPDEFMRGYTEEDLRQHPEVHNRINSMQSRALHLDAGERWRIDVEDLMLEVAGHRIVLSALIARDEALELRYDIRPSSEQVLYWSPVVSDNVGTDYNSVGSSPGPSGGTHEFVPTPPEGVEWIEVG